MIVLAAGRDAPAGPPNYGAVSPDTQADYKPMNLGSADQVKQGGIGINLFSGNTSGARMAVNQTATDTRTGSSGDAIYAYANSSNAAISAEQNASGYAIYASGGMNYFSGNVGIGTVAPGYKLDVAGDANATRFCIAGDCKDSWSAVSGVIASSPIVGRVPKWNTTGGELGNSLIYDDGSRIGIGTASPSPSYTL